MAEISARPVGRHVASEEQLAEPLESGERRPQLVRRDGEKLVLGLIELAQPSGCPRHFLLELLREVALSLGEPRVLEGEEEMERQSVREPAGGRREVAVTLDDQGSHRPLPRIEAENEASTWRRPRAWDRFGGTKARWRAGRDGGVVAGLQHEAHAVHSQDRAREL